jgi:hypothetical protein
MSEPSKWTSSVIEVARRIAEGAVGSGDPVHEATVEWLRWRISPDVWTWDGKHTSYDRAVLQLALEALLLHDSRAEAKPSCGACHACPGEHQALMILCVTCGNKRCPKAADHKNECSGSNEPGQKGSAYE